MVKAKEILSKLVDIGDKAAGTAVGMYEGALLAPFAGVYHVGDALFILVTDKTLSHLQGSYCEKVLHPVTASTNFPACIFEGGQIGMEQGFRKSFFGVPKKLFTVVSDDVYHE